MSILVRNGVFALAALVGMITWANASSRCEDCPRDERGRIARSATAKHDFMKATGYPQGRPGYVVDHVIPLACGGPDEPSNMQWQTKEEVYQG